MPWLAAAASGGLLTLCFAPWEQQWLCWLGLTPLIAVLWAGDGVHWARAFWLGYVAGLVFFWGAFYWIWQVTEPGWVVLGFYMACYFAVWSVFVVTLARPWKVPPTATTTSPVLRSRWNLWFAFLSAAAWTGLEWVRDWLFSGFGWNEIGVGLHANLPFIQIAEWTGVGGLSFMAVFVNVIFVATVRRFMLEVRLYKIRPHFDATLTLSGLLVVFFLGVHHLQQSFRRSATPGATIPLRIAAVQAGIPQLEKWNPSREAGILNTYQELTAAAIATRPQLLLWPEAATPYGLYDSRGNTYAFIADTARRAKANFLFGTLDYDFGPDGHAQADYNAAMFVPRGGVSDDGKLQVQTYRKIHLVPYGEYVPYRHDFPLFAWIVGDQVPGDFARGTEPGVFVTDDPPMRVAPLICFEDTLAPLVRAPVLLGAQLLVNITNDAWFGHTGASRQQLAEATFRAVENRRPLVRCANTGVTAFLDADGRVTQTLRQPDGSIFGAGVLSGVVQVPVNPPLTFYTRHGDVFSVACALAAGLAALLTGWRHLRKLELQRRRDRRSSVAAATGEPEAQAVP